MHDLIRDDSGVLEDHRPDRRVATPLPETLASITRLAQGVKRGGPSGVGSIALVDRGESVLRGPWMPVALGSFKWLGTCDAKSTGDGGAEMVFLEGDGLARAIEHTAKAVDLFAQGVLPFAGGFQFVLHRLAAFLLDVGVADLLFECREIACGGCRSSSTFRADFR